MVANWPGEFLVVWDFIQNSLEVSVFRLLLISFLCSTLVPDLFPIWNQSKGWESGPIFSVALLLSSILSFFWLLLIFLHFLTGTIWRDCKFGSSTILLPYLSHHRWTQSVNPSQSLFRLENNPLNETTWALQADPCIHSETVGFIEW